MILTENDLISKKHDLIRQLDKTTSDDERIVIAKKIGDVEKQLQEQLINNLEKGLKNPIPKTNQSNKVFTEKELRKILKEKYSLYQELAKKSRQIYADLVAKKRDVNRVLALVKKNDKKMVEEALRY